jgi:hypothetical protein
MHYILLLQTALEFSLTISYHSQTISHIHRSYLIQIKKSQNQPELNP